MLDIISVDDAGAIGDGVTDDSAVINGVIGSLATSGGIVLFGPKRYRGTFARANTDGVILQGTGDAINSGQGTRLLPLEGRDALDLSGSSGAVRNIQIGETGSSGRCGILMTQTAERPARMTFVTLEDVFVTGGWSGFGIYGYGIGDSAWVRVRAYNYSASNGPVVLTRDNNWGFASQAAGVTTATGYQNTGNMLMDNCEFHLPPWNGARVSGGGALIVRGADVSLRQRCMIDAATDLGAIHVVASGDGVPGTVRISDSAFSAQAGLKPNYAYFNWTSTTCYVSEGRDIAQQFGVGKSSGPVAFI